MRKIAYVHPEMRVSVANADGSDIQVLNVAGTLQTWPVWSPDGENILFSSFSTGSNGHGRIGLYLHNLRVGASRLIYENESGTDAIARCTPHYALWSPDRSRLALIARTWSNGLTLLIIDPVEGAATRKIVNGMPLFVSWSCDSKQLLVHCGPSHYVVDAVGDIETAKVSGRSSLYMAPSWSPVDDRIAILSEEFEGQQSLQVGSVSAAEVSRITQFHGVGAFSWSPIGNSIGLLRDHQAGDRLYQGLWVVDSRGGGERRIINDRVLCFFWSPSGNEIAFVTPSSESKGLLRWGIVDVRYEESLRYFTDFRPSEEQLTIFMFFDQYAQSHNPWSPDGRHLIFSGAISQRKEGGSISDAQESRILVIDSNETDSPDQVADGLLGFWSPQ